MLHYPVLITLSTSSSTLVSQSFKGDKRSYVIQLQTHSIMNFIIGEFDMIFIRSIPLLKHDLSPIRSRLRRDQFLESAHRGHREDTFRSPTVSSESHLILTFFPSRSFAITSIITISSELRTGSSRQAESGQGEPEILITTEFDRYVHIQFWTNDICIFLQ